MNGLNLTSTELLHCVDTGYKQEEDTDARFPVRLSALGHCPRKIRAILAGAKKREFSARSLRIFEQGHDRGARLAKAMQAGLTKHLGDVGFDEAERKRFMVSTELEVWCPTNIEGDRANEVVHAARLWQVEQDIKDPDQLSVMIGPDGKLFVRGRIDWMLLDTQRKEFWVIDFKTKNSWGFKKLLEEGNGYDYEVQVLGYVRGLMNDEPEWRCAGAYLFYEDHDKRNHTVLPVQLDDMGIVDEAIDRVSKVLINWVTNGPISEAPAVYAVSGNWTKKKHVAAAGCLPWQCNYCTVGPVVAGCIDKELFRLEDIAGPNDDVPKWEVYGQ